MLMLMLIFIFQFEQLLAFSELIKAFGKVIMNSLDAVFYEVLKVPLEIMKDEGNYNYNYNNNLINLNRHSTIKFVISKEKLS